MPASIPISLKIHAADEEQPSAAGTFLTAPANAPTAVAEASPAEEVNAETASPLTPVMTIAELAIASGVKCFVSQSKTAFAQVPVETPTPHVECLPLGSKDFLSRLDEIVRAGAALPETYSIKDLQKAVKQLELEALRSGRRQLETRLLRSFSARRTIGGGGRSRIADGRLRT